MATWGYGKNKGPDTWSSEFQAAKGQQQSPIDIKTELAKFNQDLETNPLTVAMDENKMSSQVLSFSGHNFKIDTPDEPSTVTGGPTNDVYKMAQYHFHWGQGDETVGSEHTVDGKYWPSELHMVHYNSSKYADFGEAADKPDGLLVLGVFLDVFDGKHDEIEKLISPLSSIRSMKTIDLSEEKIVVNLESFMPSDRSRYYTYSGSLTTPPCYESVTWVVFEQPIRIGSDQLLQFRWIHMGDACGTSENYRPVTALNGRTIHKSFQ